MPKDDDIPSITPEQFREWRSPRFGESNPQRMTNPVWEWLIHTGLNAFQANGQFQGSSPFDAGPGWCFDRFGQTSTAMPDGRTVLIGGEHEDHYDPDFYIYNDVVVLDGNAQALEIFGYPRHIFPPTDFHTATLAGDRIIIIGCLGYPADRKPEVTPVAILDLNNFAIQSKVTLNGPGWIHGHTAALSADSQSVIIRDGKREDPNGRLVENADDWQFNLIDFRWQRLTQRDWSQWEIAREDGKRIHLWEIRLLARYPKQSKNGPFSLSEVAKELGSEPDLKLALHLYHPPLPHDSLPENEDEFGVHRIRIGETVIRYLETHGAVRVIFEGPLSEEASRIVVADLVEKMSRIENSPCRPLQL